MIIQRLRTKSAQSQQTALYTLQPSSTSTYSGKIYTEVCFGFFSGECLMLLAISSPWTARDAPPSGQNFFIFMQFSEKYWSNNRLAPPLRGWRLPLGNPGSATESVSIATRFG